MNSISHNQHAAFLSEIIGPRLAGTKQEAKAADYIADQFKQIGLDTSIEEFKFLNWMPVSNPVLQILTPKQMELELAPMGYTLPSPPEGVEGILKKTGCMVLIPKIKEWIRYGITDEAGNDLAFLVKNPADGDPSPFPSGRPLLPQIGAIIGKNQAEMIDRWIDEGVEVRVRLINQCCQEVDTSGNVLAKYGNGDPDIVVCAHYDSQYLAPGAVDNGSGIQALLEIAGEIVSERCDYNILFAAFGAEEPGLLGSKAFVFRQQEMGYQSLYQEATKCLMKEQVKSYQSSGFQELMLKSAITGNTMLNDSTSHIAELMIKGNNRGLTDMWKIMNHHKNAGKESVEVAKELMDFEEKCIQSLKVYL